VVPSLPESVVSPVPEPPVSSPVPTGVVIVPVTTAVVAGPSWVFTAHPKATTSVTAIRDVLTPPEAITGQASAPATHAEAKFDSVAVIKQWIPRRAMSARRVGMRPPSPPIRIPIEATLAKPVIAKVQIAIER
jgi:hypothetical protein